MGSERRRLQLCLAIAAVVLGWAVLAYGSALDFVTEGEVVITPDEVRFIDGEPRPVRSIAAWLTGVGALCCLILLPGRKPLSRVPLALALAAGFLLLYGWFLTVNAVSEHFREATELRESWVFEEVENRPFRNAPGSIAQTESRKSMVELTFVLLAVWAAVRTAEGSAWRGLFALVALSGVAVALIGLFHKAAGAEAIYFMEDESQPARTFFAPFVYNANAGAYMNICLALSMSLALARGGDARRRAAGIAWVLASIVLVAGVIVAASKGAIFALGLTVVAVLGWNFKRLRLFSRALMAERGRKIERAVLILMLAAVMVSLAGIGVTYAVKRYAELAQRLNDPAEVDVTRRLEIAKLMLVMAGPEEGSWHGYGPGTFKHLVPYFAADGEIPASLEGDWLFGHSDPLQTAVEWGWIGAVAWSVVGGGAVLSALLLLRRRSLLRPDEVPLLRGAAVALLIVGLHSCLDFPLSIYSIHLVAMLICGVCWGLYAHRRAEHR